MRTAAVSHQRAGIANEVIGGNGSRLVEVK
jgi:hypothetical protein